MPRGVPGQASYENSLPSSLFLISITAVLRSTMKLLKRVALSTGANNGRSFVRRMLTESPSGSAFAESLHRPPPAAILVWTPSSQWLICSRISHLTPNHNSHPNPATVSSRLLIESDFFLCPRSRPAFFPVPARAQLVGSLRSRLDAF